MLQADERDAAPPHDQLPGVRCAHADHEVQVNRAVGLEQLGRAAQCLFGDGDDIHILEQALEIGAVGAQRGGNDRLGVG